MTTALRKARRGSANTQLNIALNYISGSHGFPQSERLARIWYKKSATNGNAEAMFNLGTMCLQGEGGKPDASAGIRWLKKSAQSRTRHLFSSVAPSLLADIYRKGFFGVAADVTEAKKWKKLGHQRRMANELGGNRRK